MKFKDCAEIKAIIVNDDVVLKYDSNGEMIDSSFIFEAVDEFPTKWFVEPNGVLENRFAINPNNMPEKMWMIKYGGDKERIL